MSLSEDKIVVGDVVTLHLKDKTLYAWPVVTNLTRMENGQMTWEAMYEMVRGDEIDPNYQFLVLGKEAVNGYIFLLFEDQIIMAYYRDFKKVHLSAQQSRNGHKQ